MLKSCTKQYTDESGEDAFRFIFYCDRCGNPHRAAQIPFSGADVRGDPMAEQSTIRGDALWKLRWQKEHALAFERADYEARHHFFNCPGCDEFVCTNCIASEHLPSGEIRDLCMRCSQKLGRKKSGAPLRVVRAPGPQEQSHKETSSKQSEPKGWSIWKRIRGSPPSPKE